MVQVPVFKESQRLQVSNPTGFQSSSQARVMGETLAGFGQGVANLGNKLNEMDKKQKSALAATQRDILKNALDEEARKKSYEIMGKGGDGSTWADDFDTEYDGAANTVLNQLEKSGDISQLSQEEIKAIKGSVYNGYSKNMYASGFKRQNDKLKENVSNLTARYTSNAYSSPERIEEYMDDFASSLGGAMEAMGKDKRFTDEYVRSGRQQLVRQAVLGFQDKGKFNEAKDLVLKNGAMFSPDQQRKVLSDIRDAKTTFTRESQQQADRRERELEKELKAEQVKNMNVLLGELAEAEKSGSPVALQRAQNNMISAIKKGSISSTQWGSASAQLNKSGKSVYGRTNLELAKDFYSASTPEAKAALEEKVYSKVETGELDSNSALNWMKMLNQSKSTRLLSPQEKARYDAVENKLKALLPPPDMITKQLEKLSSEAQQARASKAFSIAAELDIAKANGMSAADAFTMISLKYFDSFERMTPFVGMPGTLWKDVSSIPDASTEQQKQTMREVHAWGISKFRGDPIKAQAFEEWFTELELNLRQESVVRELRKLDKKIESSTSSDQLNLFIDRVMKDAYDSDSPDQLPLILRPQGD